MTSLLALVHVIHFTFGEKQSTRQCVHYRRHLPHSKMEKNRKILKFIHSVSQQTSLVPWMHHLPMLWSKVLSRHWDHFMARALKNSPWKAKNKIKKWSSCLPEFLWEQTLRRKRQPHCSTRVL